MWQLIASKVRIQVCHWSRRNIDATDLRRSKIQSLWFASSTDHRSSCLKSPRNQQIDVFTKYFKGNKTFSRVHDNISDLVALVTWWHQHKTIHFHSVQKQTILANHWPKPELRSKMDGLLFLQWGHCISCSGSCSAVAKRYWVQISTRIEEMQDTAPATQADSRQDEAIWKVLSLSHSIRGCSQDFLI